VVQTPVVGRISMILPVLACLLAPQAFWFLSDRPADQGGNRFRKTCEAVAAVPRNRGSAKFFVDVTDEVGLDFQHVVGPLGGLMNARWFHFENYPVVVVAYSW